MKAHRFADGMRKAVAIITELTKLRNKHYMNELSGTITREDAFNAAIDAVESWDGMTSIGRQKRIYDYIMQVPEKEMENGVKTRNFSEMISYFQSTVADMDIDRKYKLELLSMISVIELEHNVIVHRLESDKK